MKIVILELPAIILGIGAVVWVTFIVVDTTYFIAAKLEFKVMSDY